MEERYLVKIENSEYEIVVRPDGDNYIATIDGVAKQISLTDLSEISRGSGDVHALIDNQSHQVSMRRDNGSWHVFVAGKEYNTSVANYQLAQLKNRLGVKDVKSMARILKSPMPGLVLEVNVSVGDTVKAGETLLVLEAMKMENPIKSTGDGEVSKIHVSAKDSVEKGMTLIEFAD
ncbi:acetyl-CoA carboxylase biotin carboxyl carrier protein subunit [bacterium AH-315-J21]|nr:acetyl-CoA carboxylase biotin carboxyl carrier protein subunit [bacterium AH-315-J21]